MGYSPAGNLPNVPKTLLAYYERKFFDAFNANVDHHQLKVTPFVLPEFGYERHDIKLYKYGTDNFIAEIEEYADYKNLPVVLPNTAIEPAIELAIETAVQTLGIKAAGIYHVLCNQAVKKHGTNCGVGKKIRLNIVRNNQPSVADPEGLLHGWVSFRMAFCACPQEYLYTTVRLQNAIQK